MNDLLTGDLIGGLPLWGTVAAFLVAAAFIWAAGTRLSGYADTIAERTGIGKAFIGALLLGGVTSLPEGATTVTAAAIGNPQLAVNNILGGVAMQVAILAAADAVLRRRALSTEVRQPSVLVEGALLIFVLVVAAGGILVGDTSIPVLGVGVASVGVFAASVLAFYLVHEHRARDTWEPEREEQGGGERSQEGGGEPEGDTEGDTAGEPSTARLIAYTVIAGLVILVAGFVLARAGDEIAVQTGLGSSFVGAVLVAISTSLPEISTTLGAIRLREYAMAYSNIFGANILDCAILLLADLAFTGGPVLNEVGRFGLAAALLGIVLTTIYLVGLLERRERVVLRMGLDSLLVVVFYAGGLVVLYTLR